MSAVMRTTTIVTIAWDVFLIATHAVTQMKQNVMSMEHLFVELILTAVSLRTITALMPLTL